MNTIPKASRMNAAVRYLKEYGGAAVAAALMYGGTYQIFSNLKDPIAIGIIRLINAIIRKAFRGVMPLPDYSGMPWLTFTGFAAVGVIVAVVGLLVGVWVNAKSQSRQHP